MSGDASGASASAERAYEAIRARFGNRAVPDAPLGSLTTYRAGGRADLFLEVDSEGELALVHEALVSAAGPVPVLVIGQGSNLLVADEGFHGLALALGPSFSGGEVEGTTLRAGAAAKLPVLARRSAAAGLTGFEWAVGVPGSAGGALKMNAGGHGSDTRSVLERARVFDLTTGELLERRCADLSLGYRSSSLRPCDVVVGAEFRLSSGDRGRSEALIDEIVRWRRDFQPGGANAGSVFVNPAGDSAGRLVDSAGLKGFRIGTAAVSEKHANFIQCDRGGSADDVRRVMEHVRARVAESSGVNLETEVRLVGFEDCDPPLVEAVSRVAPGPEPKAGESRAREEASTSPRGRAGR